MKRLVSTWLMEKPSEFGFFAAAISTLTVILASVWIWNQPEAVSSLMTANAEAVYAKGQWWRLWTALFAHGDAGHLLSNVLLFFVFGLLLAGHFGAFVFPVMAFLLGGVTNAFVISASSPGMHLLGASGIVYWMGGVWLTLYFLLSRHLSLVQRALRTFGVALVLFVPGEAFNPKVSYKAHAIGFLLGVIFALFYFAGRKRTFRAAERYEILPSEEEVWPAEPLESPQKSVF